MRKLIELLSLRRWNLRSSSEAKITFLFIIFCRHETICTEPNTEHQGSES
jgi:hypothetical protein